MDDDDDELMLDDDPPLERHPSHYNPLRTFELPKGDQKHYKQQYADLYFLRLAKLKPAVDEVATEAWDDFEVGHHRSHPNALLWNAFTKETGWQVAGETVRHVDRVLDVRQGDLCWVAGTIYMDMPLKPNILNDISKDHWTSAEPPREKYLSPNGEDKIMLEDESGRLRLVGLPPSTALVTGCIVAVMGTENADGDFDVLDLKIPDLPRQPQRWERDDADLALAHDGDRSSGKRKKLETPERPPGGKIAIVSGLGIVGEEAKTLLIDLLMEFLLGDVGDYPEQADAMRISRLIIAGNSLAEATPLPAKKEISGKKINKKYGYDASTYNPAPTAYLDSFLSTLLPTLPITLLPGESDPANVSLPQQPIHSAMLPLSKRYGATPGVGQPPRLDSTTNPWSGDVDGWRMLGTGGQPIDDVFKYVEGDDRLGMMENLLRWRCGAPTAPDTLWCYPFQDKDPFVVEECPHVYFVGNQPKFESTVIDGPLGQTVRLIAVPRFKETGQIVLLDTDTLDTEIMKIEICDGK